MTFRKFAFNNVLRNKRLYAAYFISSLFTVMVFFTFLNFAFHPMFQEGDVNKSVVIGMSVAGGIIYVFSFFFILYSMSSFLQSRKKEFGILMIQGMSTRQIRRMVFLENMLIGFFATLFGIIFGVIFSKGILLIAENVLVLDDTLSFYLPFMAIGITFISFILLFLFISIFVTFVINTNKVVTLIKGDKVGKKEPKANVLLTIFAVLLLVVGYGIALTARGNSVVVALLPVVLLVTIGTYLLFSQLNVFVIRFLKNRKNLFWKKTNMLFLSDLSFRMKDNARVFFMVTIISTVAFSAIGTLVGFNSLLTDGMKEENLYSFSYSQTDQDEEEIAKIESILEKHQISFEKVEGIQREVAVGDGVVTFVPVDDFNQFASLIDEKEIEIRPDEAVMVDSGVRSELLPDELRTLEKDVQLDNGLRFQAKSSDGIEPNVMSVYGAYYVVGQEIFDQLPEGEYEDHVFAWEVTEGSEDAVIDAGEEISNEVLGASAIDYIIYDVHKVWSPVMFVGLFIGIVFFVSAGSFLYFRLYTDLDSDKDKFAAIGKIGLTTKEMNKVISKQIALLFFIPMIVAVLHGAVALTALSHMFDHLLIKESALVLGSFFVVQLIYFIIVRFFYTKQIKRAM